MLSLDFFGWLFDVRNLFDLDLDSITKTFKFNLV